MYRLIHIHTDPKFLHDTQRYLSSEIYNEIIFIGEKNQELIEKLDKNGIKYTIYCADDILNIVEVIKKYDGCVLNDLNNIKKDIVIHLKEYKIKIFARLFGYELYGQLLNVYLSPISLNYAHPIKLKKFNLWVYIKRKIKRITNLEFSFDKKKHDGVYKRLDAIFLMNEFEYFELKKYFYLPKFIPLHLRRKDVEKIDISAKNNTIIIGNSRHYWNNHIEVIKIINRVKFNYNVNFELFFNYGPINDYTKKIKDITNDKFKFIEDFIALDDFYDKYKKSSALIINSYRQHALGNIFSAIIYGTKLYLNEKSSTYKWLKKEGFKINNLSDLSNDLKNNTLVINQEDYNYNLELYHRLQESYDQNKFTLNVINVLKQS